MTTTRDSRQGRDQPDHRDGGAEKVTVAFLVALGAAEEGRPTMMFLTKEAVRLAAAAWPSERL